MVSFANILSAIAIIVAVVTFGINYIREKKVKTFQDIDEMFEQYYLIKDKDPNKDYKDFVKYLSQLERFAAAFNSGLYCKKIVKSRMSIILTKQYDDFIEKICCQRRKQFKREDYYENVVKLLEYCKVIPEG